MVVDEEVALRVHPLELVGESRLVLGTAGDAVQGRRGVRDVDGGRPRHVTVNATVVLILCEAIGLRQRAPVVRVAFQTAVAEIGDALLGFRALVRVVTRDAAELARALLVTTTGLHLLDMADHLDFFERAFRGRKKTDQKRCNGNPEAEVVPFATGMQDAEVPFEVALLADRIATRGVQAAGVDDGQVHAIDDFLTLHMQRARPVATLAADGETLEGRRAIAVVRPGHKLGVIGVSRRGSRHRPRARNEGSPFRIPGRVPSVPVACTRRSAIGRRSRRARTGTISPLGPGADGVSQRLGARGDRPPLGVAPRLFVDNRVALAFHGVIEPLGRERVGGRTARVLGDGKGERSAHRMLAEGLRDRGMTARAGGIADVAHPGADVEIRRVQLLGLLHRALVARGPPAAPDESRPPQRHDSQGHQTHENQRQGSSRRQRLRRLFIHG